MEIVEEKTIRKLVEKKEYRTSLYSKNPPNNTSRSHSVIKIKNGESFYFGDLFFNEDEYVKNYGNELAELSFKRQRVFIEESEEKISIKYQSYTSNSKVGKKYFVVRKLTNYITFNFKTKLFYFGYYSGKKKKTMSSRFVVNPTFNRISAIMEYIRQVDKSINYETYLYDFLDTIWDRFKLTNPQGFKTEHPESLYSLTYYIINGVKLPDNWLQFTGTFIPKKVIRKSKFNLIDAFMNNFGFKGSKVKKILNNNKWTDFGKLVFYFTIFDVDKFNKLEDHTFNELCEDVLYNEDFKYRKGGNTWWHLGKNYINELKRDTPELTNKEKDRLIKIINDTTNSINFNTIVDHLYFKKKLNNLGEKVKLKFNNYEEFISEHEEWSRLIQSYEQGDVDRYYGDIDSLKEPIEYNGELYYPVLLSKTMDYEKESQHQRNCVRTYVSRPDSIIFSIRKESDNGDERTTVEYQFRKNEILNVQERAKFNELPSLEFSEVARILLAKINLLYKLGTLKLPKMTISYPNGKVIERVSTFRSLNLDNGGSVVRLTASWDDNIGDEYEQTPVPDYMNFENRYMDILDDLP